MPEPNRAHRTSGAAPRRARQAALRPDHPPRARRGRARQGRARAEGHAGRPRCGDVRRRRSVRALTASPRSPPALIALLATAMATWIAAFIVAVAYFAVAGIAALLGKQQASSRRPRWRPSGDRHHPAPTSRSPRPASRRPARERRSAPPEEIRVRHRVDARGAGRHGRRARPARPTSRPARTTRRTRSSPDAARKVATAHRDRKVDDRVDDLRQRDAGLRRRCRRSRPSRRPRRSRRHRQAAPDADRGDRRRRARASPSATSSPAATVARLRRPAGPGGG